MLVFSRNVDERVILTMPDGRRIAVMLIEIKGTNRARLGFDAPQDVRIHREEIQQLEDAKAKA